MTDQMTDERSLKLFNDLRIVGAAAMATNDRLCLGEAFDHIASRLSALQAQQPGAQAVAWSIELADGTVAEIGWMDMRLFEAAKAIGTLAKGARYIFAYRIMEQTND